VVAQWLNVFLRRCDVLKIACLAQIVNVIAPILTSADGLVKQTIQYNLGIEVQYFVRIDFNAFRAIIDTLGTVREGDDRPAIRVLADCPLTDIFPDVPEGQSDIISGGALSTTITGTLEIVPGYNTLDSKHALWFARSRLSTNDS
jgi:anionic cell wall polymer biosynthesis LytR-Cps2A-Psr (LCP) family protein